MPSSSSIPKNRKQKTASQPQQSRRSRRAPANRVSTQFTPAQVSALTRLVNQSILRQAETKVAYYTQQNNIGGYNYTLMAINQIKPLTPYTGFLTITQGSGQGDRVGNKITITRSLFKAVIWVSPYNASTNPTPTPVIIRFWFFRVKNSVALPTTLSNFFQAGDTSVAPIGNILDLNYEVNNDVYQLMGTRDIKLGYAAFVGTPGGLPNFGYMSNNDSEMSAILNVDITRWLPPSIDFNDTATVTNSNNLFVFYEAVNQDGTTNVASTYSAQLNYQQIFEYKDF